MADLEVKRILNFTEQTTLSPGDFVAVDSSGNGTKKFSLGNLLQKDLQTLQILGCSAKRMG